MASLSLTLQAFEEANSDQRREFLLRLMDSLQNKELVTVSEICHTKLKKDLIVELPTEIAERVFQLLDPETIARCEQVSRGWRDAIRSQDTWRFCFERCRATDPGFQQYLKAIRFRPPLTPFGWHRAFVRVKRDLHRIGGNWRSGNCHEERIHCNGQGIYCLQYDDEKIVTGNRDDTVKIWPIEPPFQVIKEMRGHQGSVLCLQYDDKKVITASSDSTIRTWDIDTCEMKQIIRYHTQSVLHVRFDENRMVSCSKDHSIVIWRKKDEYGFEWEQENILNGHIAAVNVIEFDERYIASASGDRTIRVWNVDTGEAVHVLRGHERGIACLQYRGNYIVSGSSDETIRIWEVENGQMLRTLRGHTDLVRCVRFDDKYVVSGSYDRTVMIWNFHTGELHCRLEGHNNRVFRVQFDSLKIISSSQDDSMIIWDFSKLQRESHRNDYDQDADHHRAAIVNDV